MSDPSDMPEEEKPTLKHDGTGDSGRPSPVVEPPSDISENPGDSIGPYKLLQQIGEGGFGVVYMAEQTKPMKRRVALKIIKPGMDTKYVIARFEAERQALALMDHPGIAQVFEAGATETGRPYFVMELVKGVPVTLYCNRNQLKIAERLTLIRDICNAVQHAHQRGVIHRDLKPSNILVTLRGATPLVKIIDFGIAKAISQRLTDKTLVTSYGQMIGTPQYMSPEQSMTDGLDVDIRSDVYSIGVVLYELLLGRTPIDPKRVWKAPIEDIRGIIRALEPRRPSVRLQSLSEEEIKVVARNHNTEPKKMGRQMRGDLDYIVMQSLEKDRSHRYQTAAEFGDDICRFLRGEPVLAAPPTIKRRLLKTIRQHKLKLSVGTVLIAATLISMWKTRAAKMAQKVAAKRAEEVETVLGFLEDKILSAVRPKGFKGGKGVNITLKEAIDAAESDIDQTFADQPLVEARVRSNLSDSYSYLGDEAAALTQGRRALELRRSQLDQSHPDVISSTIDVAASLYGTGQFDEALKLILEAKGVCIDSLGKNHRNALSFMSAEAACYTALGRHKEALELNLETYELRRNVLGSEDRGTLASLSNLANSYRDVGQIEKALNLNEEAFKLRKNALGHEDLDTLDSMQNLAVSLKDMGQHEEARDLNERALELQKQIRGINHPDTLGTMINLSDSYRELHQFPESLNLGEEALDKMKALYGPENSEVWGAMQNLALINYDAGQFEKAVELSEETYALFKKHLGSKDPSTFTSMNLMAVSYRAVGRNDEAVEIHRKVLDFRIETFGPESRFTLDAMNNLAISLRKIGEVEEALELNERTFELRRINLGPEHSDTIVSMHNLAYSYIDVGRHNEALGLREKALERRRRILGPDHPDTLGSMNDLANSYSDSGRYSDALELREDTLERRRRVHGPDHPDTLGSIHNLARSYLKAGRNSEAEALLEELERLKAAGSTGGDN